MKLLILISKLLLKEMAAKEGTDFGNFVGLQSEEGEGHMPSEVPAAVLASVTSLVIQTRASMVWTTQSSSLLSHHPD